MTSNDTAGSPATDENPLASRCVRALLDRHGLPRYRQSAWLADAMKLSYSQAHRRMTGASTWTLEDLTQVGALLGETLAEVVAPRSPTDSVAAVIRVGVASLDCRLWLGETIDAPQPESIVAVRTASGWAALAASEAGGPAYRIERLEARPAIAARKVIAVLDDDHDLTNSIAAHLGDSGYDARPFYKTADLLSSAGTQRYDGFVIDWIVGEANTLKLIAGVRKADAACPIVVLTAQMMSGLVDETEIADAVKAHGLLFSEKPVRMSILTASLARAFTAAPPVPAAPPNSASA